MITNRKTLEKQIEAIETGLKAGSFDKEDRRVWIILEYLYSLLKPANYSTQQLEDLRRLVLEMDFDSAKGFEDWLKTENEKSLPRH